MEDPTGLTLLIRDDTYGFDLKQLLWKQQYDQPNHKEILVVILKLMNVDLQHCEVKDLRAYFTTTELEIFKDSNVIRNVENREVLARWYDVQLTLNKKNIKAHISSVRDAYVFIYAKSKSIGYLIRALALVKYAKSIFKDQLEEILGQAKEFLIECSSAYYQQLILIELIATYGHNKCQVEFTEFLEERNAHFLSIKDFRSGRFCVKSLNIIGILDGNQCNIRMAENYEAEGDQAVSEMQPNTYYPNIAADFLKGFRLIASVSDCTELRDRLEQKVPKYQVETFRTLQAGGVRMIPEIDLDEIHQKVLEMHLNTFSLAYQTLMNLPIVVKSAVETMADSYKDNAGGFSRFFSEQVKITKKGAQVAAQDVFESYAGYARTFMREKVMAYIFFVKGNLDGHLEMNRAMVFRLLQDTKSPFVPEDRYHDCIYRSITGHLYR